MCISTVNYLLYIYCKLITQYAESAGRSSVHRAGCSGAGLTEEDLGFGEHLSKAAIEDANQVLSEFHVLDLILTDGNVGGPERRNEPIGHK